MSRPGGVFITTSNGLFVGTILQKRRVSIALVAS
jgi:hypothetical protein